MIYRATPQWFIAMDDLAEAGLQQLPTIQWHPSWGQERMQKMLADRPDWCISRQRSWGVPITIFVHKETHALHPDTAALFEAVAKRVEQYGVEAWFELEPSELLGDDADQYTKVTDVLDVWFDAGSSWYSVLLQRPELSFPADVYLEGSDQYRGWFQTSLLNSMAIRGEAPYKNLLTHGFTVDADGRKMSKSIGNTIAPETIIKQYGADILRLWTAATDYSGEMAISNEIIKRQTDTYRRIRNTARFLLSNIDDFDPTQHSVASADMVALDRWIVAKAAAYQVEIREHYNAFRFHQVVQKIHHFCSIELGSFYLDIIKDRQYTCKTNGVARRSAQTAMYHILEALVRWIAPILAFTADEIWSFMPGERESSVHLVTWYEQLADDCLPGMGDAYWQAVIELRDDINKGIEDARNQGVIGSALEANVTVGLPATKAALLEKLGDELRFVLITSGATLEVITDDAIRVDVKKSTAEKCERCWHRCLDVNKYVAYPHICGRCVTNIAGEGEQRRFA